MSIRRSIPRVFLVLLVVIGLFTLPAIQGANPDNPKEVQVVNTSSNPVPTTVEGSASISGTVQAEQSGPWNVQSQQSGSWTVEAQQSGGWNVFVDGTPTVQLSDTDPLTVPELDKLAGKAASISQFHALASGGVTDETDSMLLTVPDDKLVVVRYVSARADVPGGQEVLFDVRIEKEFATERAWLVSHEQGRFNGKDVFVASEQIFLVGGPGDTVRLRARRDNTGGFMGLSAQIQGFLVDASAVE